MRMTVQLLNNKLNYHKRLEICLITLLFLHATERSNRHRKTEAENPLEILENHQSYEI